MAKDAFGFYTKGIAIRSVLRNAGRPNFSSYRELGIQGAKLERMATAFDKRFPPTLKAATAKLRKERGYHLHRLTQQSKHVDVVMSKLFGEWLYTRYEISSSERKLVPKVLRAAVRETNKQIYKATRGMRVVGPNALGNLMGLMDSWIK